MAWTCLVVDDDRKLLWALEPLLREAGFLSAFVFDGETALHQAERLTFDLFLIDAFMPGMNGRQLCRELGGRGHDGIRFLTSGVLPQDQLLATVEAGDADYAFPKTGPLETPAFIGKPLVCDRLRILANAWLRRLGRKTREVTRGTLQPSWIDFRRGAIFNDAGKPIRLSSRLQFDLVYALSMRPAQTVPTTSLYDQLYGGDLQGRRLDSLVERTRRALDSAGSSICIQRNRGCRLEVPADLEALILAARLDADPVSANTVLAGRALRSEERQN